MQKEVLLAVAIALVILGLILVAASRDEQYIPSSKPTQVYTVVVDHTRYTPSTIVVEHNSLVQIDLITAEGTETFNHGLTVNDLNIDAIAPDSIIFNATPKGTYEGYCKSCAQGPFGSEAPDKRFLIVVR